MVWKQKVEVSLGGVLGKYGQDVEIQNVEPKWNWGLARLSYQVNRKGHDKLECVKFKSQSVGKSNPSQQEFWGKLYKRTWSS